MQNKQGKIYVFTGEGKGKTSAALGVSVRAALSGMRVVIVQWYKEKRWPIAEHKLGELSKLIEIYPLGEGFYELPSDHATEDEHKRAAKKALRQARGKLGEADLLVLDEVINAIGDGLVEEEEVLELIKQRGECHVILTGRGASKRLIEEADLVTECKKIKHPFDQGEMAVKGLDY